jgi:MerR family transcriptional regulator, mercuric resistance operon regulatory protein
MMTWDKMLSPFDLVPRYRVYLPLMRTGEVAVQAGVNRQTLRYYERRGLLPEPARAASGYRAYGPDAVGIVAFIKRAQELGFTLAEVETLLDLAAGGPEDCAAARDLANRKIGEIDGKMATLRAMRDSVSQLVETCSRPGYQRECPLLQSIGESGRRRHED